jgi:glycosyltransferase involved in cell wall biosynthesis
VAPGTNLGPVHVGSPHVGRRPVASSTVLCIVPALNEEATVAAVVAAIRADLGADVVVIDDGSRDATGVVARRAGAAVVRHPFNLGVGVALRTGFRYARDEGYKVVVQVDADGQHDTGHAADLVEEIESGRADIAVGSRFASGYEVGGLRKLGMRWLSRRVSKRLGVTITDTTSGFRAFSAEAVSRFAVAYPSQYLSDTVEALLMAHDWNLRVVEVPVQMHARQGGTASAGSLKSVYHMARLQLVVALHGVRRPIVDMGPV